MKISSITSTRAVAVLVFLALFPSCGRAPVDRPGAFSYLGSPIDPLAVGELYRSRDRMIDLTAFRSKGRSSEWEGQPGWFISYYGESFSAGRAPFFAYTAFSGLDPSSPEAASRTDLYIIAVKFSDGSSADTDNLMLVEKNGPLLMLHRTWAEGSSCGAGITGMRIEGDRFFYSRELNPLLLVRLAPRTRLDFLDDGDLESGDDDCAAAANYIYDLAGDREDLTSVSLNEEPREEAAAASTAPRFQPVFDRLFNSRILEGRTTLSIEDLEEFAAAFKEACLGGKAPAAGTKP